MAQHPSHQEEQQSHGSIKSYTVGFVLSIVLTIIPIMIVWNGWLEGMTNVIVLMIFAVIQMGIQLIFFMHLREEKGPRYNLISLVLGLVIIVIIVAGSIFIMMNNVVAT
ncbi:cytochrome o ubiquinol oxidase subunit IV [Paenibacillus yanchengensis]|uniref:Cytochrome o ubiquinol oxidase subunit IV n=1 Tax=Paenibacillus yanchengensis TaxID=2035833 RepID=A0ABW4YJL8_9BACL